MSMSVDACFLHVMKFILLCFWCFFFFEIYKIYFCVQLFSCIIFIVGFIALHSIIIESVCVSFLF
jgi:hypothetical protein